MGYLYNFLYIIFWSRGLKKFKNLFYCPFDEFNCWVFLFFFIPGDKMIHQKKCFDFCNYNFLIDIFLFYVGLFIYNFFCNFNESTGSSSLYECVHVTIAIRKFNEKRTLSFGRLTSRCFVNFFGFLFARFFR